MTKTQVNELPETLVVGKFYNVRCAVMTNSQEKYFMPIIGELHKDPQFGFDKPHYHIDGRFCGKKQMIHINMEHGYSNSVCNMEKDYDAVFSVSEIVVRRMKCMRLTTGLILPPRIFINNTIPFGKKYQAWAESMIGKSCKGAKCPHLGTKMIAQENGTLLCPLHNLLGDKEKEVIVSFLSLKEINGKQM